jgi:hypothetical protein
MTITFATILIIRCIFTNTLNHHLLNSEIAGAISMRSAGQYPAKTRMDIAQTVFDGQHLGKPATIKA